MAWLVMYFKVEFLVFALIWTGLVLFGLWPASYWFSVESFHITSGPRGENHVVFARNIERDFRGSYEITVRDTKSTTVCTASDELTYSKDATLPDVITLDWWTNGECDLPQGSYANMKVVWTIVPVPEFPFYTRTVVEDSGPFVVEAPRPSQMNSPQVDTLGLQLQIQQLKTQVQELQSK